jgi:glycosyltransferase 2 family protein
MPSEASKARRTVLLALKIAVSVILLVFLFSRVDLAAVWQGAKTASPAWLLIAVLLYGANMAASAWRWHVLLKAQEVQLRRRTLIASYLVAAFFNNFLPSNIGGDVVCIRDTARPAGSKTLATTIVLFDRILGLMGLVLVAAVGATFNAGSHEPDTTVIWPAWLWAAFVLGLTAMITFVMAPRHVARLLQPLTAFNPEWVGRRIETLTDALSRFRQRPAALAGCFTGAVFVQGILVVYFLAVVRALDMPIRLWDLAVIVPISFVIQMLPVSVNGFGVREATFAVYFSRIGLPIQSALLLSLTSAVLAMLVSLTGAAVYVARNR